MMLELAGMEEDMFRMTGIECNFTWEEVGLKLGSLATHGLEFPNSRELIAYVALRDWLVLRPADGEFFIKGDVPIVIQGALIDDAAKIIYPLAPDRCFVATVIGRFPPRQVQGEGQLKGGESQRFIELGAAVSEREVICRPDHFSPTLLKLVNDHLGTLVRRINLSHNPGDAQ